MTATYTVGEAGELGLDPEGLQSFLAEHWGSPIALSLPRFYHWQFEAPPANEGRDACVVAVTGDGIPVAFMGANRRPFFLNGTQVDGAELTSWVVSPETRGSGVGQRMLAFLQSRYDVLVGMNITPVARFVYRRAGFRFVRALPRMICVLEQESVRKIATVSELGERMLALPRREEAPLRTISAPLRADEVTDAAGTLHARFNCFSRAPTHFAWRYEQHPYFAYEARRIETDDARAVIVFRTDQRDETRVLHVTDLFGDEAAFGAAVVAAETRGAELGVDFVDWYCSATSVNAHFLAANWLSTNDDAEVAVPHLLHPIELRDPPTASYTLWSRDRVSLLDIGRLYLTKADADLDRPTHEALKYRGIDP